MKQEVSPQLLFGLVVVVVGGGLLLGERLLVRWWPGHRLRVAQEAMRMVPYKNDALGLELEVAAGIYRKAEAIPGGVKIYRPEILSVGPSLTITVRPNLDGKDTFSPEVLAKWETEGATQEIPRFSFEPAKINGRDAAIVHYYRNQAMWVVAHIISPEKIVEAECTTSREDEAVYLEACEDSVRTIKIAGPEHPTAPPVEVKIVKKH